jgi:CheY-like chemotaxis protein
VRDNGSGMTEEVKRHMFEPFYTTKEQGKGTGLGLSTVFGVIKQSNGRVSVASEPGKGTTFSVYLPLLKEVAPDIGISKPKAIAGNNTETVLLVEDDEMLRRLGERVLKGSGYTVITAFNGKNALEVMERYGKPVDLLLSDVVMPGMSGRDLARELERRKLVRRTLYMSGYTDDAMVKHGALDPGIAFIYKPFSAEALAAKLREVLDGPADKAKA